MAPPDPVRPGGIGAAVAAANQRARGTMLRNHGGGHAPVSYLELFFDLVYVFAITQLSHTLHHHLSWHGLAEGLVLFLAVWWAWIFTTWVTNWANPDRAAVRVLLMALMLLGLALSAAIPDAFGASGLVFAGCYVAIQLGRTLATMAAMRSEDRARLRNMGRIAFWFACAAPLWIAGALAGPDSRLALWLAALGIEYTGPMVLFRTPVLGRSGLTDWDISGSHMAERCALFIIIALGEGIVVTGSAFAQGSMDGGQVGGLCLAFLSAALMWWLYFDLGADRGARLISGHSQAGRLARNAYTYLHMPIVLGIVVSAVGDALLLERPEGPASAALVAMQSGGAILFLAGLGLFKRFANTLGNFPMSHTVAIVLILLLALSASAHPIPAISFAAGVVALLFLACLWEWVSYHGGWMERMEALGMRFPAWVRERAERRRAAIEQQRG
ncbi:MAG TPA: low temperature requirement protein A [Novosphingobium sp.]|nr:low temperature requirement protein A [Novosphingobium sp.]HNN55328.1 low temperature requirement protein A [Novosphingobium sp.]